jgi:hypothetical protein
MRNRWLVASWTNERSLTRNKDLRQRWAHLLGMDPNTITPGSMSYHLRRLRLHGIL